ncbi:hypothetical protein [[Clostridium] fimetarium]|uniref:Uncharacterized protein n=1 Tax=[Clostridium] fimetarium TaxID=99656 RepID=A0A1I0R588_9FIRM|nr:hypothetical protein [[Clostridium] fimetarium]SEW35659.1 hypothetical protein SAMN05421659_1121 [[Clostridium] fimetarium]
MKSNIEDGLYEAFDDREYSSDKLRENIRIKLTEMEKKTIQESEIIKNQIIENEIVKNKLGKNIIVKSNKRFHMTNFNFVRKVAIAGVALMFILTITIATNVGGVKASIQKIFAFIPGVGVVKVDDIGSLYYMKGDSQTKGNENYEVKLNYIYPDMKLVIGDKIYESWSSVSGGNKCETWIDVKDVTWNLTDVYQIVVQDIKFDFSLQDYEVYEQAEGIGPTQRLNDISMTAIPKWEENSVVIALYDLNYSKFDSIGGYNKYSLSQYTPYLTIGDATINREKIDLDRGEEKMVFDLSGIELTEDLKANAVIHIPRIGVGKKENQKIGISIAKDGTYHASKESVQFSDSTMHIIKVEKASKVEKYKDFENCLKFTLKFDYNMENLELENFSKLLLSDGKVKNLGWSCEYDENTGYYSLYIQDYAETSKIKSITFGELNYYINDEYQIDLGR